MMQNFLAGGGAQVVPALAGADDFFGRPELGGNSVVHTHMPTHCSAGCLALRVPDPPQYAPSAVCALSADGKLAAVGGRDVELYIWNVDTGDLMSKVRGHDIFWVPSHDDTFFVTCQEDGKILMWDRGTMRTTITLGEVSDGITSCHISPDDKHVVVGNSRGNVYCWDTDTGSVYHSYEGVHSGPIAFANVYELAGQQVVVSCGTKDHAIVLWDQQSGAELLLIDIKDLEHAKNMRYDVARDGTKAAVWCTDSVPFPNLVVVDLRTQARMSVYCHEGLTRQAVFSSDASRLVSCGSDGKVSIWDSSTLENMQTLMGHEGAVLCCSINEAGTRIASGGEDCSLRLWDVAEGKQLLVFQAQDEPIKQCAFSATGHRVLTSDVTGRVFVWSMHAEFLLNLMRRYADNISACAMSNDLKLCLVGCNNGRVMLWDTEKRECVWEYTHHTGRVEAVAFNSMREMCATSGADGQVTLLYVENGKQANSFIATDDPMGSLAFSPDDEKLAALGTDGKLYLYTVESASRKPRNVLRNSMGRINSFVWSPNSKLLAGCCQDGTIMVWNASSGGIHTVLEGVAASATCCAFDLIGKLLAMGTVLGTTLLYNLETTDLLCELKGNASPVREVVFNHETSQLTTMCSRQAVVWDVASAQKIRVIDFVVDKAGDFKSAPHPFRWAVAHNSTVIYDHESEAIVYDMLLIDDPLLRSYYLSDVQTISGGLNHRRLLVWSAAGNTSPDKFHTTHDAITSTHFSCDDRLVVLGTQDGLVVVYDVVHSETVETIMGHQNGPCRCVRFSHDNSEILSCGADSKVVLWDWRKRQASRIYSGHFISIGCCDLSSQGNRVVSGDNHGMICVWEKDSGNPVQTLPLAHSRAVLSVSMSSDGSTIASVGADAKVSIWNVDLGIELVSLSAAMESQPLYCAFSPDGNKLAVTESNGNVMVWNVAAGCQWFMIFQAHKGKVTSCSWSGDCRKFVTAGTDSVMGIWDAESGAPLFRFAVKSGALTSCSVSPAGQYVAGGSTTGTLSVCNVATAQRNTPEPSFLYHWLSTHEKKTNKYLYARLSTMYPFLCNVQDAQGWSLVLHAMSRGNAEVASIILDAITPEAGIMGIISAVPYVVQTRVQFHQAGEEGGRSTNMGRSFSMRKAAVAEAAEDSGLAGHKSFIAGDTSRPPAAMDATKSMRQRRNSVSAVAASLANIAGLGKGTDDDGQLLGPDMRQNSNLRDVLVQRSVKSFSQNLKKVAVELFTEKRDLDHMMLIHNNALALALNSKSSECVQVLLDNTAANKVSWGSYHALTDMMPSLAARYPFMCYQFLAAMDLRALGDLEVPVAVMKGLDRSVIRTAPIFTNVKNLWQSHLKLHEVKYGPQPYAHVKASMVRLPYACSIGRDSLLQTLVESDVPVQAYGTPTLRAVIKHKWRLYARMRLMTRTIVYIIYTLLFTVYGVLYAQENTSLDTPAYWKSSGKAKFHLILNAYLFAQASWYAWTELSQMYAIGLHYYFASYWNVLDMVSIILMLIINPFHVIRVSCEEGGALAPMTAFTMILVWFKLLFYALAFEPTGPFVHMVFQISFAVRSFAVLLLMVCTAFGVAMMMLSMYVPSNTQQFQFVNDFGRTLLTMWRAVLGQFYIDWALGTAWQELSIIFFSAFMFLVQIILLNMLIALMRDIYQRVRSTEEDVFLKGRAMLIVEVETLMAKRMLERYANMPPYVHLLMPVKRRDVAVRDALEGRLDALEQMLARIADQMERNPSGTGLAVSGPSHMGGGGLGGDKGLDGSSGDTTAVSALTQEQMNLIQLQASRLKEVDDQFPAVLRQLDRLQRTVNNQELRLEGVVTVLRDIENLLRNQQPVVIHQEARPAQRRTNVLTEAELELEVKRLLGKTDEKL